MLKSKSFLIGVLVCCVFENSFASFEINGYGARPRGMGLAYIGRADSPDAIFINCSGLAQIDQPSMYLFYSRPFGMKELAVGSLAAVVPSQYAHLGAGFISFGNELYQEQIAVIALSRSIRQKLYLGMKIQYMKLQINGYGSNFSYSLDVGLLAKITDGIRWGFAATNLNRAQIGAAHEQLPQTFSSGLSILPVSGLILNMDIFKDIDFPAELRVGIEYRILNRLAIRSGLTTQPDNFCAGLGLSFSYFAVDYAITNHPDLGMTHQFGIQLKLNP